MTTTALPTGVRITSANKCSFCHGSKCCTYVTQHLDTPRSMADFDVLLWQVSHRGVRLYKDTDGWFLLFESPCTHLQPDGGCAIYERRPQICRDHSNDYCEFDAPSEESFELYFPDYDALLAYCRTRFKGWDRRRSA